MAFDLSKFMNTKFEPRVEVVELNKELTAFFPGGEKPVFKVRGLTGPELASVHSAVDRNRNLAAAIEGLLSDDVVNNIKNLKTTLGITKDRPAEIARRLEMFILGVVEPTGLSLEFAVRFCESFPVDFYHVTGVISRLTGEGAMPGKSQPSGGKGK